MHIETERKFLIELPTLKQLEQQKSVRIQEMVQTYLSSSGSTERRVRKITENGTVCYIYTEKRPMEGVKISRFEDEREISENEYHAFLRDSVTELTKTRYSFPYHEHVIEIDVYPYSIGGDALVSKAVLEVELSDAEENFDLPEFIVVLRELTGTRAFSNKSLAKPKTWK